MPHIIHMFMFMFSLLFYIQGNKTNSRNLQRKLIRRQNGPVGRKFNKYLCTACLVLRRSILHHPLWTLKDAFRPKKPKLPTQKNDSQKEDGPSSSSFCVDIANLHLYPTFSDGKLEGGWMGEVEKINEKFTRLIKPVVNVHRDQGRQWRKERGGGGDRGR